MESKLRFRLFIDGELADEFWTELNSLCEQEFNVNMNRQLDLIRDAMILGKRHCVEYFDPDEPEERAYKRFGDDKAFMVNPVEVMS